MLNITVLHFTTFLVRPLGIRVDLFTTVFNITIGKNDISLQCNGEYFFLPTDSDTKALDDLLDKIADGLANNDKCKDLEVPAGCRITEDCVKITCEKNDFGKRLVVTSKLNRYD